MTKEPTKDFYWFEWKLAEEKGNTSWAKACKEQYRLLVMESLKRPYLEHHEALKVFPPININ